MVNKKAYQLFDRPYFPENIDRCRYSLLRKIERQEVQ